MTRRIPACPFCGPHPVRTREEFEKSLSGTFARDTFMRSVCDNCFVAIVGKMVYDEQPINEAEQLDGAR